jgi:hypothetical protein
VVLTDTRAEFSLLIVANALFYPLLMAGVAGMAVAKSDFWSKEIALDSFQALRPATSAELVFAKFKTTGLLTLLGCLVAVPLIWWLTRLSNWQDLWNVAELRQKLAQLLPADRPGATVFASVAVLTTVVIMWHSMIGSLSTAVSGRKRTINLHVFFGGALFILLVLLIRWLSFHPVALLRFAPIFCAACASVLIWKLADTIRAFREVFHQRMASRRAIAILVFLWFLGAASTGALAWMLWNCTAAPQRLLSFALVWLFPNGALAQSIVNLTLNRHR